MNISVFLPRALPRNPGLASGAARLDDSRWYRGLGNSLAPLVRPPDSVRVIPCTLEDLAPGDLVLLVQPDGKLLGQVVHETDPLALASLLGRIEHDADFRLLGRVVAVRRGGVRLGLWRPVRQLALLTSRSTTRLRQSELIRDSVQRARQAMTSNRTIALRRMVVGELETRRLVPADFNTLLLFASEHLPFSPEFLQRKLMGRWAKDGAAVGTFDERGRLRAFAFLDDYRDDPVGLDGLWIRSVFVEPMVRGMGVAQVLIDGLCVIAKRHQAPKVRAAIEKDNIASLIAFKRQLFVHASESDMAWYNAAWAKTGSTRTWIIVERDLEVDPGDLPTEQS